MDCQPAQPERSSNVLCARFQKRLLLEKSSLKMTLAVSDVLKSFKHLTCFGNIPPSET